MSLKIGENLINVATVKKSILQHLNTELNLNVTLTIVLCMSR